ncbi:hypothetical protein BAE44_0002649 [Dichanthelium oligosanthes]|uniref:Mediator of RNA polymerase II transcription subunit 21 n=1 Tax=Dichanthelium oligosanthes TaxID=888268 RepID=A0A1E5WG14_9POAL|nr:hypothetical protein BAE44_0002649 [Dichanthelium oligosanthes]
MDVITQLQEQLNGMRWPLLRSTPLARSSVMRRPTASPAANRTRSTPTLSPRTIPNPRSSPARGAATAARVRPLRAPQGHEPRPRPRGQEEELLWLSMQFDALVVALPLSSEEDQMKRIQQLQSENEIVGFELQKQLEAAERELKLVEVLFNEATDSCINLKKPD